MSVIEKEKLSEIIVDFSTVYVFIYFVYRFYYSKYAPIKALPSHHSLQCCLKFYDYIHIIVWIFYFWSVSQYLIKGKVEHIPFLSHTNY